MPSPASPAAPRTSYAFFCACAPGLEALLAAELESHGLRGKQVPGGVELRGSAPQLWTACRHSRLAESVRVRLKPFVARDFPTLVRELERLPWRAYVRPGAAVSARVSCHKSRLWHSDAVAERLLAVVAKSCGSATSDDAEANRLYVRIAHDRVQVSVDAGGERLHRRGYRTHVAEASLRETLAAALVRVAEEHAPARPLLWDPFCGAGTIGLEWLETRLGRAPGARRQFAFEGWPTHDRAAYALWLAEREQEEAHMALPPLTELRVLNSDLSSSALEAARSNAETAGLASRSEWWLGDFAEVSERVPEGALVITNPPYGVRVGERGNPAALFQRFGRLLERRPDLRPVVLLLPRNATLTVNGNKSREVLRTSNGGLTVGIHRIA